MALRLAFTTSALLAGLSGCATEEEVAKTSAEDGTNITLDWQQGETFYLATSYRVVGAKTSEIPVDFDDAFNGVADPEFGEHWSDDVVWTYQVVESGLVPSPDDELYRFAETRRGVESLAVIKASIDYSLNTDAEILEADPVIYMVFREKRDRMAGLISFVNVDGERIESAYSTTKLDRSWSTLSQSMMTKAPSYLAPFSAKWGDAEGMLENGSIVTSDRVDDGVTDIFYDEEMGGGTVVSRYEDGAPWPTRTLTGNVDIRLMGAADIEEMRWESGGMYPEPNTENFDYRAALQTSVDMERSLTLSPEVIAEGKLVASVAQEFKPWAGAWWPLKKGELIFGYSSRDTISDRIREDVDPIKKEMDGLSAEIRKLDDGDEKDEKRDLYSEKQKELVEKIKEFYGKLYSDLDGGKIVYTDGKLSHTEDEWSYDLNELSPMDKFALKQYDLGNTQNNPFYLMAWEILNSYNPGGESWWGHCNGWAAAAILTHEPRETIETQIGDNTVEFTTGDIKGLLTESHYSTYSQFYGERYNDEENDVSDLQPKAFHNLITFFIKEQGVPMVFDTTATEAVWNFPAYAFDMTIKETTEEMANDVNINTATAEALAELPGISPELAEAIVTFRTDTGPFQAVEDLTKVEGIGDAELAAVKEQITINAYQRSFNVMATVTLTTDGVDVAHIDGDEPNNFKDSWTYDLFTDADGLVLDGKWKDEKDHPDFAWIPYNNPKNSGRGSSENPFLGYGELLDLIGSDFERK
jgi:competence ComEA-like helix-hairpin-helix protein